MRSRRENLPQVKKDLETVWLKWPEHEGVTSPKKRKLGHFLSETYSNSLVARSTPVGSNNNDLQQGQVKLGGS